MRYAILTQIGHMYKNEAGSISVDRFPALEGLSKRLQTHIALAEQLKAGTLGAAKVATNLPPIGLRGERVGRLVQFHENEAKKWSYLEKVNSEVAYLRKWLSRQGVHQTFDGKIIWPMSGRKVEYDSTLEKQGLTRITFENGLLYLQDKPFDTTKMVTYFSGPGHAIYVMSKEGHFHVSSHAVGYRHHSSLLAGGIVACAGEMKVDHGRLVVLSNKSGHYHPDLRHLFQTLSELQARNVPMTFSIRKSPENSLFHSVDAFMHDHDGDNEAFQAQKVFRMIEPGNLAKFLGAHQLAFLTASPNSGVSVTGFHRVEDGRPPAHVYTDNVEYMLRKENVPLSGTYVKAGAGR